MNQQLRPASAVIAAAGASPPDWVGGEFVREKAPTADP